MDYLAQARKALAEARERDIEARMPILSPRLVGVLAGLVARCPDVVLTWAGG